MNSLFNSQFGQDEYLEQHIFLSEHNLFFVEVGSADPVEINNTYFFEQHRGWHGLLIDARLSVYESLKRKRTSEAIHACIDNKVGRSIFFDYGYLSGLARHMTSKEYDYIEHYNNTDKAVRAVWVDTKPLWALLSERLIDRVDLLAVDVEGAEIAVLQTIDFNAVYVDVIMVESNTNEAADKLDCFMDDKHFLFIKSIGADRIYINSRSKRLNSVSKICNNVQLDVVSVDANNTNIKK